MVIQAVKYFLLVVKCECLVYYFSIHLRIIYDEETRNYGCLFLLLLLLGSSFEEERGENFVLMCGV